nr:PREDICTED: protein KASH5-like [Latimeria chalumnae]|eukprot:XP_005989770.2 PREDICTED: protein KASH5-like [Latimeria chalumnae]
MDARTTGVPQNIDKTVSSELRFEDPWEDPEDSAFNTHTIHSEFLNKESRVESYVSEDVPESAAGANVCSEEELLNITFEACDANRTGEVPASIVMHYLQDMTGQNPDSGRLLLLYNMLDPKRLDTLIDKEKFHTTMKKWISDCCKDYISDDDYEDKSENENMWINGNERSMSSSDLFVAFQGEKEESQIEVRGLINSVAELQYANQKLNEQNLSLQNVLEFSEEANLQLTEEIAKLKNKLLSTRQSLLNARSLADELEDIRDRAKDLQEMNCQLQTCCKELKKENKSLAAKLCFLKEVNEILEKEKKCIKARTSNMLKVNAELMERIHDMQSLLSARDAAVIEKTILIKELETSCAENHKTIEVVYRI